MKQKTKNILDHFLLGVITGFMSIALHGNLWPALWFMIAVELTQISIYGIKDRVKDTLLDILMDLIGLSVILIIYITYQYNVDKEIPISWPNVVHEEKIGSSSV